MQTATIDYEEGDPSDIVIDVCKQGDEIPEDRLEYNEITKKTKEVKMPTECSGDLN